MAGKTVAILFYEFVYTDGTLNKQMTGGELPFLDRNDIEQHLNIKAFGDSINLEQLIKELYQSLFNENMVQEQKNVELKEGVAAEPDEKLCIICQEHFRDTVLLDCGHFGVCESCAKTLKNCPMCRGPVVKTVKTFNI